MKKIAYSIFFVALLSCSALGQNSNYEDLLNKAKKGETSLDFRALRYAFADITPVEKRTVEPKLHVQMMTLLNEKKFKDVLKISDEIHKTHFVDMNSHVMASLAYQGLRDAKRSKFHEGIYVGLVNSILNNGDGNTAKTAYSVITIAEQFVVLDAIELKRGPHVVEVVDGQTYNVMTATEKASGQAVKVYFNIEKAKTGLAPVP